eukprot:jgi/Tetstr1/464988/TSEL_009719.t1
MDILGSGFCDMVDPQWGRGACQHLPDMSRSLYGNCNRHTPPVPQMECELLCGETCHNAYCDCGLRQCVCLPGFTGPGCSMLLRESAGCGPHGRCTLRPQQRAFSQRLGYHTIQECVFHCAARGFSVFGLAYPAGAPPGKCFLRLMESATLGEVPCLVAPGRECMDSGDGVEWEGSSHMLAAQRCTV